jgi:amino acid transporter
MKKTIIVCAIVVCILSILAFFGSDFLVELMKQIPLWAWLMSFIILAVMWTFADDIREEKKNNSSS